MKKSILTACLFTPFLLSAQAPANSTDSITEVLAREESQDYTTLQDAKTGSDLFVKAYDTLHENAPHLEHIPNVPRFALLGKEGKYYMGIGANIKTVAEYDFGHPISNPNLFMPVNIPMTIAPGNGGQFHLNAQQSNIYLNVVALPGTKDQIGAYVQFYLTGNNYAPSLQYAYLKYRGFTVGYNFSLFSDLAATPATIDFQGPNAFTGMLHCNASYEKSFGKNNGWTAGIGLDMTAASITNATNTATVNQRVPDIPFYIQKNWAGGNGWLRASGIIRNLYYRDLVAQKNVDKVGWGVKLSGSTPIYGNLSGCWQAVYGKGIASYIQDLGGAGMDLMPDPNNSGRLEAVKAWAAYGALRYDFSPKVYTDFIYSHVRTYAHDFADSSSDWNSGYRYAQYVGANIFYQVNSIVQVGAEYLYGRRVDFDGMQAHDNRLEAMFQVSF